MRYEDAYARVHPFDRPFPEISETAGAWEMIEEAVALAFTAVDAGRSPRSSRTTER